MELILKESIDKALETIQKEKKNIEKIKKEVDEFGLIKLENQSKKVRNINKFHDIRFKKSIITLKNNLTFIKEFSPKNSFAPFFNQITPPINKKKNKKRKIQEQINLKKVKGFSNEPFIISIFKEEIKEKITNEIQEISKLLKEKLDKLAKEVYIQLNPKNKEEIKMKESIEKEGIQPLTTKGKLWDFLIATTPNKKELIPYIDYLLEFEEEEIINMDEYAKKYFNESFIKKVEMFKKYKNINTLQPLRTSIILFNQYFSQIEKKIVLSKYYKKENFNERFLHFLNELESIKEIFKLKIELTNAQKILTFSYIRDIIEHIQSTKTLQPITLINTSEVGTGKTFTIPFVAYIISMQYLNKFSRKSVFLIITEANLLLETKQKLIDEVGLDEEHIEIIQNNELENHKIIPWKIYLLSKNRLQLINPESYRTFATKCKKDNLLINIISDEASYLKNKSSKTSFSYNTIKSKLIKEKVLGFEMLMTATPVSNDTGDIPYIVNPNNKIVQKMQNETDYNGTYYSNFKKSYEHLLKQNDQKLTLKEILKLAAYGFNKPVFLYNKSEYTDPKTIALLSVYSYKHFNEKEYIETLSRKKHNKEEIHENIMKSPRIKLIQEHTGLTPTKKNLNQNYATKAGVKNKKISLQLLDSLNHITELKGIDRILNSEEVNNSVLTNSIILETNFIEAIAFNEMIKNSRIIANFQKFKELSTILKEFNTTIEDIENEKFAIRHYLIAQILNDLELINIKHLKRIIQIDMSRKIKINTIKVKKSEYIEELEQLLQNNPEEIIKNILTEINPISMFKKQEIEKELEKNTSATKRKELENTLNKIEYTLNQELNALINLKGKNIYKNLIKTIKKDLEILSVFPHSELLFIPTSLSNYSYFMEKIENKLKLEPKLNSIFENPHLYEKIKNYNLSVMNVYSTIFQASESLNMPIITKHLKRTARAVKENIEKDIEITEFNFEKMALFIAKNASSVINTMKAVKEFTKQNNTPALIATNYRNSAELLYDKNKDYFISGNISQEKRKNIINQLNKIENKRNLVASANSILKGISFFYLPYGIIPETPKNAEFRTQIAGRLRTLFPQHINLIKENKNNFPEKEKCFDLLLKNQKYFDIVSSEIMLSFPNIQQEKNILIETVKYLSQHIGLTKIEIKDILSKEDTAYNYVFNKNIIEKYSEQIKKEKINDFKKILKEKNIKKVNMDELLNILSEYLDKISNRNLKKTTIYKLIKE